MWDHSFPWKKQHPFPSVAKPSDIHDKIMHMERQWKIFCLNCTSAKEHPFPVFPTPDALLSLPLTPENMRNPEKGIEQRTAHGITDRGRTRWRRGTGFVVRIRYLDGTHSKSFHWHPSSDLLLSWWRRWRRKRWDRNEKKVRDFDSSAFDPFSPLISSCSEQCDSLFSKTSSLCSHVHMELRPEITSRIFPLMRKRHAWDGLIHCQSGKRTSSVQNIRMILTAVAMPDHYTLIPLCMYEFLPTQWNLSMGTLSTWRYQRMVSHSCHYDERDLSFSRALAMWVCMWYRLMRKKWAHRQHLNGLGKHAYFVCWSISC